MSIRFQKSALVVAGLLAGLAVILSARPAGAQPDDEEIHQLVARVSYISGDVSFSRGDDPDEWQDGAVNAPMTLGDRLYSGDSGRVELALRGGDYIRLASGTDLSALNLTEDVRQFSLSAGTAAFYVRRLEGDETFEVDTPNVAVTFDAPGDYRIDVDQDGNSRVQVHRGQAIVAAGGGQVPLESGNEMRIDGIDAPQYDIVPLSASDSFDVWVNRRQRRLISVRSYRYVNPSVVGAEDLDRYGRWQSVPGYGYCWTPSEVNVGWAPYRLGHWAWLDPWGWNWIADEPWGWAPYHYGRWVTYSSRWYWVPVGPSVGYVHYSPALVAFVGGGPGWSASVAIGAEGGYVGWFPLAPRDPFIPWWGRRAGPQVNVTNVTYVNRSYVTIVNHNTFVSGGNVATSAVRDPGVMRQIAAAPVVRGALPVIPTASSLRIAAKANVSAPARPSAAVSNRSVVTRVAPPPAPPKFEAKIAAIRENRGAPVSAAAAAKLSVEAHNGAKPASPVRPVEARPGSLTFQPRRPGIAAKPQPVTAPKGKALATAERPVVSAPAEAAKPNAAPPAKIAPGAVVTRPAGEPAPAPKPQPRSESWRNAPPPPTSTGKPPARPAEGQKPLTKSVEEPKPAPRPAEERKVIPPPQPRAETPPRREVPPPPPAAREGRPTPPPAVREAPPRSPQNVEERRPATQARPATPPPSGKSVKPEEKKPQKPLEKKDDKDKDKDKKKDNQ